MKAFITRFTTFFKNQYALHKRRTIILGGIAAIIILAIATRTPTLLETVVVKRGELKETVLATGTVTSVTDLSLSFTTADVVREIKVKVGDQVKKGDILATLDGRDELAALQSARAKYQQVVEGASTEEIAVAQSAYDAAVSDLATTKRVQDAIVKSSYQALLSNDLEAFPADEQLSGDLPTISGNYTGVETGKYELDLESDYRGDPTVEFRGLETGVTKVNTITPEPLGTRGLSILFVEDYNSSKDRFTVLIPNTRSSTYLTFYNNYQEAVRNRENAVAQKEAIVAQRKASLDLERATARPFEFLAAQADVTAAQAQYDDTILRAPEDGTIVSIDMKVGELVQSLKQVMVLQDVGNLYLEADINETNIARIALNQDVSITFDAFGAERIVTAQVTQIDPSATIENGIVNYKIKVGLNEVPDAKPGMTANMTIVIAQKPDVLIIPRRATFEKDGTLYVQRVTDLKRQKTEDRALVVGMKGDGDSVEVVSGLAEGDTLIALPVIK